MGKLDAAWRATQLRDTMRAAAREAQIHGEGVHCHVVGCWVRIIERVIEELREKEKS